MDEQLDVTITAKNFSRWLLLGLPSTVFWAIGGLGAFSLLGGLSNGTVTPGDGSSASSLGTMWGCIVVCALGGIFLGMRSLFRTVPRRFLLYSTALGFVSLFFSILAG
ncbi:MAG: hypothetical protein L3K26_04750 [Candidatus Hydrogenedentes bacterium]|nr:hypothetical protein [Candidatus Hydrogenedentota bacterium]